MMTIGELEIAYRELRGRLLCGELDEEVFKTQVERLRFEDKRGRRWKIGWYTRNWYRCGRGQPVQDRPESKVVRALEVRR